MEGLGQQVYCSNCKGKRDHKIITTYEESSDVTDDFQWHAQYHIVKCAGCRKVAFVEQYGDEDMWKYVGGKREWDWELIEAFKVYPEEPKQETEEERLESLLQISAKSFSNVPKDIINLYNQIIESFNMNHSILCASGVRTLIEGICVQLNIKKGYLYDEEGNKKADDEGIIRKHESLGARIFGLYESGHVVFSQSLILQKVTKMGNLAVHRMISQDYLTLREIIKIVEKVIYDIYELRHHKFLKE
ncbi:hypothetical protein [Peribacillus asahii]|uniref:hypothetical protein n=1 Tax=Peribacillus asahii TaxID=228899 RepID=UPI00382D32E6